MKKKIVILQALYYVLVPFIFIAFYGCCSRLIPDHASLGTVMTATYGILFIGSPIVAAALMRFSLLRWYMDPFAAAEIPLCLYLMMLMKQSKRCGSLAESLTALHHSLDPEGFLFLVGLFFFGLIASVSPARKQGQNFVYHLIEKP